MSDGQRDSLAQLRAKAARLKEELGQLPPPRTRSERLADAQAAIDAGIANLRQMRLVKPSWACPGYRHSLNTYAPFAAAYFAAGFRALARIEVCGRWYDLVNFIGGVPPDRDLPKYMHDRLQEHFEWVRGTFDDWSHNSGEVGMIRPFGDETVRACWQLMVGHALVMEDEQGLAYREQTWTSDNGVWVLRPEVLEQGREMYEKWPAFHARELRRAQ